ncbi:MAG: 23S rRNA (pseudouridine(1915)-N(3))-methyltransferase RlmH [Clostridiales bacterium]|nr:23S rRNA (pseudouridine(1915)-N(3))-methyltransferase RlmH [Clostridiales bacterium]
MKLAVAAVGGLREGFYREACAEYCRRMAVMRPVEILEVREERIADENSPSQVERALEREGGRILALLRDGDVPVSLSPAGRQADSAEFACMIDPGADPDAKRMVFIIGSSHGLSPSVYGKCRLSLSLGPMTFPHQLARVILLEQIYRGQMINAGRAYHK